MAQIDFPNSPTVGQTYTAPSGATYTWDGVKWTGSPVQSQTIPEVGGNSGKYLYTDGTIMTWADPPLAGSLENIYPPDGYGDTEAVIYSDLTEFIAQPPERSQASQWQWSNDNTFTTIGHDTGTVLYEPVNRVYNSINPTIQLDTGVVGGDTMIPCGAIDSGDVYWRTRFQKSSDSTWTDWTTPFRFVYEANPMCAFSAPGATTGYQYDPVTDTGYYGFVSSTDFITGLALGSLTGFTAGTDQHSDAGWLKFYVGPTAVCNSTPGTAKCIFIAKQTFKHTVSWDDINSAGLVYGNTQRTVLGQSYNVRLMTCGEADPGTGSEWNELMYRVHAAQPESKSNWETFDTIETNITSGDGRYTWCQETRPSNPSYRVYRGYYSITYWTNNVSSKSSSNFGWRPVLELAD